MKVIDMHCDTVSRLLDNKRKGLKHSFLSNEFSIDIEKMKKGDYLLQNLALFTDQKASPVPESETMALLDMYYTVLEENKDLIAPVLRYEDIIKNEKDNKISVMLTLEDGGVVFNDLAMLRNYYRFGVRMIALTWNYPNGIGYPNISMKEHDIKRIDDKNGLTEFGIEYVKEMERLGMIIDVSHLGDKGFYDVLKYTNKPFVASHSNARSMCHAARNLSDDMIKELSKRGGVMGINFCGDFLSEEKPSDNYSSIKDMIRHIKHITKVGGIDCVGLGTDFDGIKPNLEIKDASMMPLLEKALYEEGFKEEEIAKIFYKNVLRVYKEILG